MSYKKYNDYELIYMVRENDEVSYNILFNKYLPIIKSTAYEFYKSYSNYGYELDDFIQEGYCSFQKALKYYDETKEILFYTFLCLCLKRSFITFCNKISGTRNSVNQNDMIDCNSVDIFSTDDFVENIINERIVEKNLKDFLLELTFEDSVVFELKLNHFTHKEIGLLLELPVSTIDYRLRKIRNLLKKRLLNNNF